MCGEIEVLDGGERAEPLLDVGELEEAGSRIAHQRAPPIWTRTRVPRPMMAMAIIASHVSPKLISDTAAGSYALDWLSRFRYGPNAGRARNVAIVNSPRTMASVRKAPLRSATRM